MSLARMGGQTRAFASHPVLHAFFSVLAPEQAQRSLGILGQVARRPRLPAHQGIHGVVINQVIRQVHVLCADRVLAGNAGLVPVLRAFVINAVKGIRVDAFILIIQIVEHDRRIMSKCNQVLSVRCFRQHVSGQAAVHTAILHHRLPVAGLPGEELVLRVDAGLVIILPVVYLVEGVGVYALLLLVQVIEYHRRSPLFRGLRLGHVAEGVVAGIKVGGTELHMSVLRCLFWCPFVVVPVLD